MNMNRIRAMIWWLASLGAVKFFAAGGGSGAPNLDSGGSGGSPSPGSASASPAQGQSGGNSPSPGTGNGNDGGAGASGSGGQGQGQSSQGQGAGTGNDQNLATLRQNYERYSNLGKFEDVQRAHQSWTTLRTNGARMADALGYTSESFEATFAADPVGTMHQLQTEWAQAQQGHGNQGQGQNNEEDVASIVRRETAPLMQHVVKQKADAANVLFDNEVNTLMGEHALFKGDKSVPAEIKSVIYDMVSESIKYDDEAVRALYNGQKTPAVKKYFDGVMERFMKTVNAYIQWQGSKGNRQGELGQGQGDNSPAKVSLDDIINGEEKALNQFATVRAQRL